MKYAIATTKQVDQLIRPLGFGRQRQRRRPIPLLKHKFFSAFSDDAEMRLYLIRPVMRRGEQRAEEDGHSDEEGQVAW